MQLKRIIAVIASLGLTQAFQFTAEEVTDGIYAVQTDASGKEYLQYLGAGNTTLPTNTNQRRAMHPKLMARDSSGCTNKGLDHASTDAANAMLQNYCGGGTGYTSDKMVFTSGGVFAYTCDYTGGQECFSSEDGTANSETTAVCGLYVSGWTLMSTNKNYGYDTVGTGFCGNLG